MVNEDIRWIQRFQNFSKACILLAEIKNYKFEDTTPIIREGFIQRFEITFELAWKTMKDYLEFEGIKVQPTPRAVIKEAFSTSMISDGQIFIDMLVARNEMAHRYDEEVFNKVFIQIQQVFYEAFEELCIFLKSKLV